MIKVVLEAESAPQPSCIKPGDPATILAYSDRYPGTVVATSKKHIVIQEDHAIRTDSNGVSESQEYEYSRNEKGKLWVFTLRKNGKWIEEHHSMKSPGNGLLLHHREKYYDFGF